jgi:hypothetical protein
MYGAIWKQMGDDAMARPEVTGRKVSGGRRRKDPNRARLPDEESEAASIATFCRRHSISVAKYYELRAEGRGPIESLVDGRVLITKENQDAWRQSLPVRGGAPQSDAA